MTSQATPFYNLPSGQGIPYNGFALTANQPAQIDLTLSQAAFALGAMQSIFVDNRNGATPITLTAQGSQQRVTVPAYSQIWSPFYLRIPSIVYFFTTSNTTIDVFLTSALIPPGTWSASGTLLLRGNSDTILQQRIGNLYFKQERSTIGSSILMPAVAGYRWFVTSINVQVPLGFTTAGDVVAQIKDGATVIFTATIPNPATPTNMNMVLMDQSGIFCQAASLGSSLQLEVSNAAFTAKWVAASIFGGYTALPT